MSGVGGNISQQLHGLSRVKSRIIKQRPFFRSRNLSENNRPDESKDESTNSKVSCCAPFKNENSPNTHPSTIASGIQQERTYSFSWIVCFSILTYTWSLMKSILDFLAITKTRWQLPFENEFAEKKILRKLRKSSLIVLGAQLSKKQLTQVSDSAS